jgi:hypothetical protein
MTSSTFPCAEGENTPEVASQQNLIDDFDDEEEEIFDPQACLTRVFAQANLRKYAKIY